MKTSFKTLAMLGTILAGTVGFAAAQDGRYYDRDDYRYDNRSVDNDDYRYQNRSYIATTIVRKSRLRPR